MPKISIIIPNYNHESYLNERIDSVLNQTYQDFEVIILDDCSTDNSREIIEQYRNNPKVSHIIFNEINSGSTFKQWKKGIELAKGEWIWIAESDDVSDYLFLEILLKYTNENNVDVIYSQSFDVNENNNIIGNRLDYTNDFIPNLWKNDFILEGKKFIENYLIKKNVIPNTSAVLLKNTIKLKDLIDSELMSLKMCGDWLFYIKFLKYSNIAFVGKNLNRFRNHKDVTRNHFNRDKKKLRLKEESIIRRYLEKEKYNQDQYIEKLYGEWYKINKLKDILTIRVTNQSLLKFIIKKVL